MGCGATTGTSGICEQVVAGCGELWRVVGELWQARINGVRVYYGILIRLRYHSFDEYMRKTGSVRHVLLDRGLEW